jgi:hypothetical protein
LKTESKAKKGQRSKMNRNSSTMQIEGEDNESERQEGKSEKQEEAWEEAFREPEEETEGVGDEEEDETLHN